ncbi:hypothetical protein [Enterococcus faecium]|uniref:hypothetical protein n=1 Tax=Enterococcus faecium TaxID=1352 RepID=UPI001F27883E|nr:hypothetical protein [Enterococcus faecium]
MGGMDDNTNQLMWIIYILLIGAVLYGIFSVGFKEIGDMVLKYVKDLIPVLGS